MRRAPPDPSSLATTASRLAVLLEAGVSPAAAWGYLADDANARAVVATIGRGLPVPEAIVADVTARRVATPGSETAAANDAARIGESTWRGFATAWAVATEAGASLAPSLLRFAGALREQSQVRREIGVALAAPTATARLVLWLPLVGILLGLLLGFDTVGVLVGSPVGWTCGSVGLALVWSAWRWNRRLVRGAQPRDAVPGLTFDLVAIAVSGGGALDGALALVATCAERCGLALELDDVVLLGVLDLSRRAGVPAAALLRAEASEQRRAAFATAQADARALGVRLIIPLGVCILPAFIAVSVVPLLFAVLKQTTPPG